MKFPLEVPALRLEQPMGICYVVVLPAAILLDVAYSDLATATLRPDGQGYLLTGTERLEKSARLPHIAAYINRADAAFPNSIILAANFRQDVDLTEDDEPDDIDGEIVRTGHQETRWTVKELPDGCHILRIPTKARLAAIIDGQHRLFAFAQARKDRWSMNLVCSIYLDLPKPFQAQLFATINSTQKPVSKSLTYELFGYNIAEEEAEYWTPDKLAVFLTRKLGTDDESPLKGRIIVAPKQDDALKKITASSGWKVSTAVVVEGILRLYSSNPKRDSNFMLDGEPKKRGALSLAARDRSPLRDAFLSVNDKAIYILTLNYLKACDDVFWKRARGNSFILKTVGVQALFDILRRLSGEAYKNGDLRVQSFRERLAPASQIDFSTDYFHNASGSGRSAIRKAIEQEIGGI